MSFVFEIEKLEKSSAKFVCKKWEKNKKKNEAEVNTGFSNGKIFEKVGVNFSEVSGKFSKDIKKIPGAGKKGTFWASGISVVMHMKKIQIYQQCISTQIYLYIIWMVWWRNGFTPCVKDLGEKK